MLSMKRLPCCVLLALCFTANLAAAQTPDSSTHGASYAEDASSALARYVRILASDPDNLEALLGAGRAAIAIEDNDAALTFFARAEEVAPRDGRVKAGMGSALVQDEQPQAALKFFADAIDLGMPAAQIASDRGLAYDMIGDPDRAQADYALALRRGSDAEIERRMALSKAISGDRAGALAVLGPQLRQRDRAGWRAQAFVLALTGDTAGAVKAVRAAMPGPEASEMEPFLTRLPKLTAAERAMAVHFGRFPGEIRTVSRPQSVLVPSTSSIQAQSPVPTQRPDTVSAQTHKTAPPSRNMNFADVAVLVAELPAGDTQAAGPEAAAKPQKGASPTPAKPAAAKKAKPAPPKEPSRIWVQLASGTNKTSLPHEFERIKGKARKLLAKKTAWTVRAGSTNRLLIGPFKTAGEAREMVNTLSKADIASFSWTSEAGQVIEKLPIR